MQKKIESLKKLYEVIEKNELAQNAYYDCGRNCAIGHLLKIGGVTDNQLVYMDNGYYGKYGYSIAEVLSKRNDVSNDFVGKTLERLGFELDNDLEMLFNLQRINDSHKKDELLCHINETIKRMERKLK